MGESTGTLLGSYKTTAIPCGTRLFGKFEEVENRLRLGCRSAGLADHAVDGLGRLGANGEPLVSDGKIDGEVGAFEKRIVGAELLDVTAVATLAAVNGNDFIVRAVFGALAVESDGYGHGVKALLHARERAGAEIARSTVECQAES